MNSIDLIASVLLSAAALLLAVRLALVKIVVEEGQVGLVLRHGKLLRIAGAGAHYFLRRGLATRGVDVRERAFAVPGQDVLCQDGVGIKVTLAARIAVVDPVVATFHVQHMESSLYQLVQVALRKTVASQSVESLLEGRLEIGRQLLESVAPEAARIGVEVRSIEVKDVILPGELKRASLELIAAKKHGAAALEKARGESAALRNLANAGRMLDGNPGLLQLRALQTVETAGAAPGTTLVMGVPGEMAGFARPANK